MKNNYCLRVVKCLTHAASAMLLLGAGSAQAETPYKIGWTRQLGTTNADQCHGVSADGLGNVYISGSTSGTLGEASLGSLDAYVSKYDAEGKLLWTRQFGTAEADQSRSVSADGLGNVYITGYTAGSMGAPNAGGLDAFVSKFDAQGNLLWTRQLGTSHDEQSHSVSADSMRSIYISGSTCGALDGTRSDHDHDAFVSKYDDQGTFLWTRQLGTSNQDVSYGVSADRHGNACITGYTSGSLDGINAGVGDAFASKYDAEGKLLWTRQFGTSDWDQCNGVSTDGHGNFFITGLTWGSLHEGNSAGRTAFVSKFDSQGTTLWTRQMVAAASSVGTSVSSDGMGNLYISGSAVDWKDGSRAGAFVSKYDSAGNLIWTQQVGTNDMNSSQGVTADKLKNVFIAGTILGSLDIPNAGAGDAFVVKLTPADGPAIWMLALAGAAIVIALRFLFARFN